jgi:hypothetical protein
MARCYKHPYVTSSHFLVIVTSILSSPVNCINHACSDMSRLLVLYCYLRKILRYMYILSIICFFGISNAIMQVLILAQRLIL